MRVLGINAVFHDPAAAPVFNGQMVAAREEEPEPVPACLPAISPFVVRR